MEVKIQDEVWNMDNTSTAVQHLFDRINDLLNGKKLHISSMTIDSEVLYGRFQEYIEQKLSEIETISVNVVTTRQYVDELVAESYAYCTQAVGLLPDLSTSFYQTPSQQAWQEFETFLEGIEWLTKLINLIGELEVSYSNVAEYAGVGLELSQISSALLQGVESKEYTVIGDLLQYEILPQIQKLQRELGQSMSEEGVQE